MKNEYVNMSNVLVLILATTCGAVVANLYYAQTIILEIGKSFQLSVELCGLIVTLSQIGYGLGLLLIVPLADIIENKKLILGLLLILAISLFAMIIVKTKLIFLLSFLAMGISAAVAQIIVPFVTHFTPLESRGKVTGTIMSGLLFGIMLARPLASFLSDLFMWKSIFIFSYALILLLIFILYFKLPKRIPEHKINYSKLIYSLPFIIKDYPVLRRRAIYHAVLFGVFSLFWTSVAIHLMEDYHYSQSFVALFAFVGAAGALIAPYAGRLADRGLTKIATGSAILIVGLSCILANTWHDQIILLVIAALLIDGGVACNLVLGQRSIYALAPQIRSRLNGLYMSIFFTGGAIGSGVSGYLYAHGGWSSIMSAGAMAIVCVYIYFLTEPKNI